MAFIVHYKIELEQKIYIVNGSEGNGVVDLLVLHTYFDSISY